MRPARTARIRNSSSDSAARRSVCTAVGYHGQPPHALTIFRLVWVACERLCCYNTAMQTVMQNVKDLDLPDRQTLERLIGRTLTDDLRLIIHILNVDEPHLPSPGAAVGSAPLPTWFNVYEGLTDEAIASVEATFLTRASLTRAAE